MTLQQSVFEFRNDGAVVSRTCSPAADHLDWFVEPCSLRFLPSEDGEPHSLAGRGQLLILTAKNRQDRENKDEHSGKLRCSTCFEKPRSCRFVKGRLRRTHPITSSRHFWHRYFLDIVCGWVRLHTLFWLGFFSDQLTAIYKTHELPLESATSRPSGRPSLEVEASPIARRSFLNSAEVGGATAGPALEYDIMSGFDIDEFGIARAELAQFSAFRSSIAFLVKETLPLGIG
jgi:hypothetical protein